MAMGERVGDLKFLMFLLTFWWQASRVKQPSLAVVSANEADFTDNRISCSFSRMKYVNDPKNQVYPVGNGEYYYILMAKGQVDTGTCNQLYIFLAYSN